MLVNITKCFGNKLQPETLENASSLKVSGKGLAPEEFPIVYYMLS